jgi:alpha-mannosidase
MKEVRTMMDELYQPFQLFFGKGNSGESNTDLNILNDINLPVNIQLMTFEKMSESSLLIRFAHQFAINEDPNLSKSVQINLNSLLHQYSIKNIREVTLSANQEKSERTKSKIIWKSTNANRNLVELGEQVEIDNKTRNFIFTIRPMEIKTFIVDI